MTTTQDLIDRTRASLEDWGYVVTTTFTLTANDPANTIYQLPSTPIKSLPLPALTDNGVVQTYGTNFTVNLNNGELTVLGAQTSGHVLTATYTNVLYRDERIIQAFGDGIRRLYPRVYKIGECYINLQTQKYEYDLSSTVDVPEASTFAAGTCSSDYVASIARADLAKAQTRIHSARYMYVGGINMMSWRPFYNFTRTGAHNVYTDTTSNTGDVLKLVYSAPCTPPVTVNDPIDVPDGYIDMPVWYALATLMTRGEAPRDRSDSYQTQSMANANAAGLQRATGDYYLQLFNKTLIDNPMRPMPTEIRKTLPAFARQYP